MSRTDVILPDHAWMHAGGCASHVTSNKIQIVITLTFLKLEMYIFMTAVNVPVLSN